MSTARAARGAALLLLHAALVVWLTWPLAALLATDLPSTHPLNLFDTLFIAWSLAWESHALATHPSLLLQANIYHPAPHALLYGPMGFGTLPYFLPTYLLTGNPALALNLTFLLCVALTAWTLHLVVARWTGSELAGFLAAWTLLTTRWVLWNWGPLAPNYVVLQYFPLIVLLAGSSDRRFPSLLWLVPLVVLQGLADVYLATALLVPLGLLTLVRLVRPTTRSGGWRLLVVVAVASGMLFAGYLGLLVVRAENPSLHQQTVWTFPAAPTVLPWGLLDPHVPTAVPAAALILLAAGTLALLVRLGGTAGTRRRRAWTAGAFWAAVGIAQSLSPVVVWQGRLVRLPQAYVARWLPIYEAVREPARLGVAALIGLAILVGVAFAECTAPLRSVRRGRPLALLGTSALAAAVAVAMYAGYRDGFGLPPAYRPPTLPSAYPLVRAMSPDSPLVARLREPGGPLLELPIGTGGLSPGLHAAAMYRSIFHWRPLLNGYSSYWPTGFPERMQLAARLPDPAALAALRREAGLDVILVHTADLGPERAAWDALAAHGGRDDLTLVERDGGDLLFRVTP